MIFKPDCDSIIFDLDGTLWDASAVTATGWTKVARSLNLDLNLDSTAIKSVSGLPFDQCVETLFKDNFSSVPNLKTLLDQAEKTEVLGQGGSLYAGVATGIIELKKHYKLFLVSNCQEWYLNCFFEHSGLKNQFDDALCFGQTKLSKTENIKIILNRNKSQKSVYVGDTYWDQKAAYYAGVKFIFAQYGFGSINVNRCPSIESFSQLVEWMTTSTNKPHIEFRRLAEHEFEAAQRFYRSVEYYQPISIENKFYGAFHNRELIGLVRLAQEENQWVLRGMEISSQYQCLGVGTNLLRLLDADLNGTNCFCLPYGWLEGFYSQISFHKVSNLSGTPKFLVDRLIENRKKYPEIILMKRSNRLNLIGSSYSS